MRIVDGTFGEMGVEMACTSTFCTCVQIKIIIFIIVIMLSYITFIRQS